MRTETGNLKNKEKAALNDLGSFQVSDLLFPLYAYLLFAPGLHCRNADEILWQCIRRESLGGHLDQTDKGAFKVWEVSTTPINDGSGGDHHTTEFADDVDGFLYATSPGDNILSHKEALAGSHFKSAHNKAAVTILLHKDMACAKMARNFLTHDDAANGGRNNSRELTVRLRVVGTKLRSQCPADLRGNRGILQEQCALEEFAAVEARAEDEVTVE
jgi:hypothetical protein